MRGLGFWLGHVDLDGRQVLQIDPNRDIQNVNARSYGAQGGCVSK